MFEERILQFFCTDEQHANQVDAEPVLGLVALPKKEWDGFQVICTKDEDCPRTDLGQVCTKFYWDAVADGSSYQTGEACFNWDEKVCPSDDFSSINYNHSNTDWSHYIQYSCLDEGSGASTLLSTSAVLLAMFTVF